MGLLSLIGILLQIYSFIMLGRVILSYFPQADYNNPIVRFIYDVTEPVLRPIRQLLPPTGMMDFSPLVVIIGIYLLQILLGV